MLRRILVVVVIASVATLAVFALVSPDRAASSFPVEPGTEHAFPAEYLVRGDRFTCHGAPVPLEGPGFGFVAGSGLRSGTALDGSVTIRCPSHPGEL